MESRKTFLVHNKDFHEQMSDMASERNKNFFTNTLRDVFILGMAYAAKKSLKPIDLKNREKKESIRISEVIDDDHKFLFKVLAYSHTRDYKVLADETKFYELAEKFANAGLKEIIEKYHKTDYPSFKLAEIALEE